ncbi:SH3 domain-containing protein [Streptomyces sp. NPDC006012]|uniref:SH3 domain-containing protein n=1 Tax=Streptomyces sp. NPDC006012 TaxID=3364739 RepID=UPI0036CFD9F1
MEDNDTKTTEATEAAETSATAEGTANGVRAEAESVAAQANVRTYPVAPGVRLNVRSGPGTNYAVTRVLPAGMHVPIFCQAPGTRVTGPYGTSNLWDNIDNGEYVSDAYVYTGRDGYVASRCAI